MRLLTAAGAALLIPGLAGPELAGIGGTAVAATSPHGRISTVIGGRGGPAPATSVSVYPCALKYVRGELYFSSYGAVVDRVSQRTGRLVPIAGNGISSPYEAGSPDGTPALAATLSRPCGVAVDGAGNVLVAAGPRVLAVAGKTGTFYRKRMTAGRLYTVASGFRVASAKGALSGGAVDVQLDSSGNLVIAVAGTFESHTHPEGDSLVFVYAERAGTFYGKKMAKGRLYHVGGSLDGYTLANAVPATRADLGLSIGAVRLDSAGNIVIADQAGGGGGSSDAYVMPQVRVIANRTGTFYGQHMKAGYIYTIAADLPAASGVALDRAGNVLVAAGPLRVIAVKSGVFYGKKMTAGDIYTLPGFGSANNVATSVAVDTASNVLVATQGDTSWTGNVRMLAGKTGSYYGKSVRAGRIYTIAGNGRNRNSGDGGPATSAELEPWAVATLRSGQITAVADLLSSVVRVVPERTGIFFGRSMRAGFIYPVAGTGVTGFSGDGGPGTGSRLGQPTSVAFDQQDNLLIADWRTGRVRVVAAKTGSYYGQDMTAGHIYTAVGGGTEGPVSGIPARDEKFAGPVAVATDPAGNVFIIDGSGIVTGTQVWMVAARTGTSYGQSVTAGDAYLLAGDGTPGHAGDGGPATAAEIESAGLAVDGGGNLVLADQRRVRVVAGKTGTFYGQAMTAGDIYTVAGGGTQEGNGTPALKAYFGPHILRVAIDPAGNLLTGGDGTVFMVAERTGSFYGKAAHAGDVYSVAFDNYSRTVPGDGGPAVGARFSAVGLAVQPRTGNLLIADELTGRVRSVSG